MRIRDEGLTKAPAVAVVTNEGAAKKANQDAYLYLRIGPSQSEGWDTQPGQSRYVAGVADGVTGQAAGDYASVLAVKTIDKVLRQQDPGRAAPECLQEALLAANQAILQAAAQNPTQRGMSTTIVLAVVEQWQLYLAHLGDSRAYLIRNRAIHQLTLDHTWVQEALDVGRLSVAEAQQHPNRHTITKHLGLPSGLQVDTNIYFPGVNLRYEQRQPLPSLSLAAGDALLLCSDGVTDKISDKEIAQIINAHKNTPQRAVNQLVKQALARQEGDNITAVLLVMPGGARGLRFPTPFNEGKVRPLLYTLLLLLLLLGFWLALGGNPFPTPAPTTQSTTVSQLEVTPTAATPTVEPPTLVPVAATDAETATTPVLTTLVTPTSTMADAVTPTLVRLTPTATNTASTPTARPTATRVAITPGAIASLPSISSPTIAAQWTTITPAVLSTDECASCTVTLNEPLDPLLHGRRTFRWTPTFALGSQYLFELVFWEDGQNAMQHGRSPLGAGPATTVSVDLVKAAAGLGLSENTTYTWGVLLVDAEETSKRIHQLSAGQKFQLQFFDGGNDNSGGSGDSD